ncbi:MAG: flagellar export chaperone FliS [Vagococcus sp.]|uniref:flagellar export chaperone FliS n=1 Tax=Vagococcus sp. TaxID=1933889 RepID=UPI002FC6568D
MSYNKGNTAYLNNQILTASPKRLIEMLFEAGIKHLKVGIYHLEKQNHEQSNAHLIKVQEIILELKMSIQQIPGSDISHQLNDLYDFMYNQLIQANINKDKEKLEMVQHMLEELVDTWRSL